MSPHDKETAFNFITAYNSIGFELLKLNEKRQSLSSKLNAADPAKLSDIDKLALKEIKFSPANDIFGQLVFNYGLISQAREEISEIVQKVTSVKASSISQEKWGEIQTALAKQGVIMFEDSTAHSIGSTYACERSGYFDLENQRFVIWNRKTNEEEYLTFDELQQKFKIDPKITIEGMVTIQPKPQMRSAQPVYIQSLGILSAKKYEYIPPKIPDEFNEKTWKDLEKQLFHKGVVLFTSQDEAAVGSTYGKKSICHFDQVTKNFSIFNFGGGQTEHISLEELVKRYELSDSK